MGSSEPTTLGRFLAGALGVMAASASAQVINVDALIHCNTGTVPTTFVAVNLDAGEYVLWPIGPASGGTHTAWNAWGSPPAGCDANGENCAQGWLHAYRVESVEEPSWSTGAECICESAALALSMARPFDLSLSMNQEVRFFIGDSACPDNLGGVSIRIAPHCPGDADLNGVVDVNDITYVVFRLGDAATRHADDGDADRSGSIDVNDITYIVFRLGTSCP